MLAVVLFGQLPGDGRWVADLSNAAHGPAFAVVTLVVFVLLRHWPAKRMSLVGEYSAAILVSVLLGALVELLQHFTGRDASLADLGTDFLGTVAAAGGLLAFDQRARRRARLIASFLALAACALMIAPLAGTAATYLNRDRSFPTLLDLKSPLADTFLRIGESATAERAELPRELQSAARDDIGMRVQLTEESGWIAVLTEPVPDWREYTNLNIDVANPTDEPLALRLRVFDQRQQRNRRTGFRGSIELAPYSRAVHTFALDTMNSGETGAPTDTSLVHSVVIARAGSNRAREFYLVRIWLD
jgi:hypothetical protein